MTIKQRILQYLQDHPEGVDDDVLTEALNLSRRQTTNIQCHKLENDGFIVRKHVRGKIHNFLTGVPISSPPSIPVNTNVSNTNQLRSDNWFWEGNVQAQVIKYLVKQGFSIKSVADTASFQRGVDIVAEIKGKTLWVSAKGYPQGTERTNPTVQAAHWFKDVIFSIIEYRQREKDVYLVVVLPDFPRYHYMAQKITWIKPIAKFTYFWVNEQGEVSTE
jgi:hypothetical protein